MSTGLRAKCERCKQHKYLKYMIDSKAGLCHHCNNTKPIDKPIFKNGLYYKAGTNLVIRANPYNL